MVTQFMVFPILPIATPICGIQWHTYIRKSPHTTPTHPFPPTTQRENTRKITHIAPMNCNWYLFTIEGTCSRWSLNSRDQYWVWLVWIALRMSLQRFALAPRFLHGQNGIACEFNSLQFTSLWFYLFFFTRENAEWEFDC